MRVLECLVTVGPQLVRILSSSPSTSSCSGHPTKDVHPEPAEGLFSHSELSATGCGPAALCVLLTPLAASLTQKQGGTGCWSYQFSRGHQTEQNLARLRRRPLHAISPISHYPPSSVTLPVQPHRITRIPPVRKGFLCKQPPYNGSANRNSSPPVHPATRCRSIRTANPTRLPARWKWC